MNLPAEITLDRDLLALDCLRDFHQLLFREFPCPHVAVHSGLLQDLQGCGLPDSVDVAERSFDALLVGDLDSENTCHIVWRRCERAKGA